MFQPLQNNFYRRRGGLHTLGDVFVQHSNKDTCRAVFNECCKTKTKVITLANYKGHRQSSEPIKTQTNYMYGWHEAPENVRERVTIGFGFTPDLLRK